MACLAWLCSTSERFYSKTLTGVALLQSLESMEFATLELECFAGSGQFLRFLLWSHTKHTLCYDWKSIWAPA
ncbi:hypothetical protein Zm00014a_014746 [Zea mays]|uniref:Uncharacterized protein n=1 Tax=Zea mays TaxID=4577 RepID=A0A3L6EST1_MAIZE|nr:hypothetical protein Zm00014a_014746 [Zea mays]